MLTRNPAPILACLAQSAAGELHFPTVVARLGELGVDFYHADFLRSELTVYLAGDESFALPLALDPHPVGAVFDAQAVVAAIRGAQRDEIRYPAFADLIRAAGCAGYTVHLTGRRAVYSGRTGERHVEEFPPVV